jgi:putative hemolysin
VVICFVAKITAPLVWLLTVSTNGVLRLFRIDPNAKNEEVSEEEIKMMVDAGSQQGVIDTQEQEIIHNLFEFDDKTVADFSTHRTEMVILWMEDDLQTWEETIRNHRHSLYPLCEESADNVVGILNIKDYFRMPVEERSRENVMENAVRPPFFVPESVKADVLFRKMQSSHYHFAVVIDEYGGTSGIVTMNDLLEQLVGDLEDDAEEAVQETPEILQINETTWDVQGSATLEDVVRTLCVTLPLEEYDTFGGYVFAELGSIPEDGTTCVVETESLAIQVTNVLDHQMDTAIVTVTAPVETDEEEENDEE